MTPAARSARPNASRCLRASRRAGLPGRGVCANRRLAFHFVSSKHAEAHPFEVGNARRQQAFGPDDAARIEDGPRRHPDYPFPRFGAAPPRTRPFEVAAAVMARKTARWALAASPGPMWARRCFPLLTTAICKSRKGGGT